jgi:small subunit ribosomal protein S6
LTANVYEGLFILDSNRYSRDQAGVSNQISEMITQVGGEILASRLWEERRLAYAIGSHRKGTYWLTYFRVNTDQLTGLNRACQLNDNVVRSMFLKVDPRIVETLVSHALTSGGPVVERRGAATPAADAPAVDAAAVDAPAVDVAVSPAEVAVETEEV